MKRGALVVCLALAACGGGAGQGAVDAGRLVREHFSGDDALATVAAIEHHIRWPGNRGFDATIDHVARELAAAGFVAERDATRSDRLTYRIEAYPLREPAWEPLAASLAIEGDDDALLDFTTNRNMLAVNSWATGEAGVAVEVIDLRSIDDASIRAGAVRGKIVYGEGGLSYDALVRRGGAAGLLVYAMPDYTQPAVNRDAIQFDAIPYDATARAWQINLSYAARERLVAALARGPVRVTVRADVAWTSDASERVLIADVRGAGAADERFILSAHVQEPGANDNASGVATLLEIAETVASLLGSAKIKPARSLTFLWGDEYRAVGRYVGQDPDRRQGIRWGMSLDMVGQDTDVTGGTFLIEKMPDPSAIWQRGGESFSDWGGRRLNKDEMRPHFLNDFVIARASEQAATNGWIVRTNPFEGGSDHAQLLAKGIPGVLLWHFTDPFYHTDLDRLDKVSADEMKNVGVTALASALMLADGSTNVALQVIGEVGIAASNRLVREAELGRAAIAAGGSLDQELEILRTWYRWYDAALETTLAIEVGGASDDSRALVALQRDALWNAYQTAVTFVRQ